MTKLPDKPKKILVIRYRFIGDTVLTVPFLRNLHYQYPDAEIDMLIESVSGTFLKYCPYINKLITFEDNKKTENKKNKKLNLFKHIKLIRKEKYDMAFVLKRSFSSALMAFLSGIPHRIGFDTEFRGWMLTDKIDYNTDKHESDCFLDLLRCVDIPIKDNYLEAWTGETERKYIDDTLSQETLKASQNILINASASNPNKMWTDINFAKIINQLINDFDSQIFILGTEKDRETYDKIQSKLSKPLKHKIINLIGKTDIIESIELIKRMDLVIGVDSGILHLAASVNVPTIAIFGPMNDVKWGPLGEENTIITAPVSCRPCNLHKECNNCMICMTNISDHEVIAIAAKYLKVRK